MVRRPGVDPFTESRVGDAYLLPVKIQVVTAREQLRNVRWAEAGCGGQVASAGRPVGSWVISVRHSCFFLGGRPIVCWRWVRWCTCAAASCCAPPVRSMSWVFSGLLLVREGCVRRIPMRPLPRLASTSRFRAYPSRGLRVWSSARATRNACQPRGGEHTATSEPGGKKSTEERGNRALRINEPARDDEAACRLLRRSLPRVPNRRRGGASRLTLGVGRARRAGLHAILRPLHGDRRPP